MTYPSTPAPGYPDQPAMPPMPHSARPAPYGQTGSYPAPPVAYPAPQQGGYPAPQQGGYPAPALPAYPVSQFTRPEQGGPQRCRVCGSVPAADVTFRGHRGLIVLMQFRQSKGPFCRDCGLATYRDMTAKTLLQGWYGYASFVITPITVLINLARRGKVANLPAPTPDLRSPQQQRRPLDPGEPLYLRPSAIIGALIPIGLIVLIVVLAAASGS